MVALLPKAFQMDGIRLESTNIVLKPPLSTEFRDVWLGEYMGRLVIIKLRASDRKTTKDAMRFASMIRISDPFSIQQKAMGSNPNVYW